MKTKIIIVSPSLDPKQNVSGISSVTQFIISNNPDCHYIHFELGRKDNESGGLSRVKVIMKSLILWNRILNSYPEALVHYNFPLSKMSILRDPLFMMIARWKRRKMVIHLHGGIFLTTPHIPKYLKCILQSVFSFSFPCIVLSYLEKKLVVERFHCKNVYVLPNCVDLNNAKDFHREYLDNKNVLTLGYLGRIAETKRIEYLLEACVELKRRNIPFVLRMAGKEEIEGQYLSRFQTELGNSFIYEGVVFGQSKNIFLQKINVFMLPSFFEGLPMSLLESMSYGVVPVTTNVGSIGEIVKDGYNGLIIEKQDTMSIVEQCVKLVYNKELMNSLSQKARCTIFDRFHIAGYIDSLNSIYASCLIE